MTELAGRPAGRDPVGRDGFRGGSVQGEHDGDRAFGGAAGCRVPGEDRDPDDQYNAGDGREEIHYSTVDMTVFDLYSGEGEIIKAGASSTFIKRKGLCGAPEFHQSSHRRVNSIEIDSVKRRLGDGDFVIMVTDGVLDALPVGEQDILLETIIQGSAITNPKEMAQHVLEQVLNWTGKEPADDMTVLAVGIWAC